PGHVEALDDLDVGLEVARELLKPRDCVGDRRTRVHARNVVGFQARNLLRTAHLVVGQMGSVPALEEALRELTNVHTWTVASAGPSIEQQDSHFREWLASRQARSDARWSAAGESAANPGVTTDQLPPRCRACAAFGSCAV